MEWMLDIQLGRRNLSPIQRIAIAEKYRSIYEKQARDNLKLASGGDRRSEDFKKNQGSQNSSKVENKIDVRAKFLPPPIPLKKEKPEILLLKLLVGEQEQKTLARITVLVVPLFIYHKASHFIL